MVPGFHGLDLIVILVIALLIFGPKKLPEMGSAIGKSIKEFRKGMNELTSPKEATEEEARLPAAPTEVNKLNTTTHQDEVSSKTVKSEVSSTETRSE